MPPGTENLDGNALILVVGIMVGVYVIDKAFGWFKKFRDAPADRKSETDLAIKQLAKAVSDSCDNTNKGVLETLSKVSDTMDKVADIKPVFETGMRDLRDKMEELVIEHRHTNQMQMNQGDAMHRLLSDGETIKESLHNLIKYSGKQ